MVWVLSLYSIPHGMHLVFSTHPCFFWVVYHPSGTFSPKEPKQEPQNRFSPLPTARPYPLASDPWPITSCIGWVQAGDVWALRVLYFCVCPKLARCPCVCRGLEAHLHILPPILNFLWRELFSDFSFFMACSLQALGFAWLLALLPSAHSFTPFCRLATISYRTTLPFLLWCLFNPSQLGLFGPAAYSSLNDSIWSLGFLLHCLQAPVSHLFPLGHPWPIFFPWASSALFLILRSHGLLLTPLGFPDPITLSFIIGAHGFSISPLLSLLALLRACCSSFSLFSITYYSWVCYFSLFKLL